MRFDELVSKYELAREKQARVKLRKEIDNMLADESATFRDVAVFATSLIATSVVIAITTTIMVAIAGSLRK